MVHSLTAHSLSLHAQVIWKEFAKFQFWLPWLPGAWFEPETGCSGAFQSLLAIIHLMPRDSLAPPGHVFRRFVPGSDNESHEHNHSTGAVTRGLRASWCLLLESVPQAGRWVGAGDCLGTENVLAPASKWPWPVLLLRCHSHLSELHNHFKWFLF